MLTKPRSASIRCLSIVMPLLLLASAAAASAQTVINTVPYVISASGKYVLGTNVSNPSNSGTVAIDITAPNVILDLNGFFVSGTGNTGGGNTVIRVNNVANVTIRNGLVANAAFGIAFAANTNSRNFLLENVTVSRCYMRGVLFTEPSPGSIVRNCSFSNIGNATTGASSVAIAIFTDGGVRIENNSIANVTGTGNNGTSVGIAAASTDFSIGNTISNSVVGISGGKYLNNLTSGCTTPFSGGTNATGNN